MLQPRGLAADAVPMKRTPIFVLAAGLLCMPLIACGGSHATRMVGARRADVSAGGHVGEIRLGAGDPVGNMLQDYYLTHFQRTGQADEAVVFHGASDIVDPSP